MKLKTLKYCRNKGLENEWSLEGKPLNNQFGQAITFEDINLMVGKNASGKSQLINSFYLITCLFSDQSARVDSHFYLNLNYFIEIGDENLNYAYSLIIENHKIIEEILIENEIEKINRSKGIMWNEEAKKNLTFKLAPQFSLFSKRDEFQYPYLEPLINWSKNLAEYDFGGDLGKFDFIEANKPLPDFKGDKQALPIIDEELLKEKRQKTPSIVIKNTIDDMACIGYELKSIGLDSLMHGNFHKGICIFVKERNNTNPISQLEISQGMFRALSLLLQLNYSLENKKPSCILIDDIGEGLDFDRSKSLIDLIISKVENSSIQIIMTTNDRFVMNKIPLKYWSVIHKTDKKSLFYNYKNSKEVFDEYKYSGLSNFDFLSTEFYLAGFETDEL